MSIIYDHDAIRDRMRGAKSVEKPVPSPASQWVCLNCGFWWLGSNGHACTVCGAHTPQDSAS